MNSRKKWITHFQEATTGHAIDAEQAYNSSIKEAEDFVKNGIIKKNDTVLDLGSGNGRQAIGLLENKIKKYIGIEPIKDCVEFSKKTFSEFRQCEFIWIDLYNEAYNKQGAIKPEKFIIPFPDKHFDAVITGSLFSHLGTLNVCEHYLEEIHRVLKEGGRLFSSWFRMPPNKLSKDHGRSVFKEADIITIVTDKFTLYHTRGGFSADYNDQWCLYCKK